MKRNGEQQAVSSKQQAAISMMQVWCKKQAANNSHTQARKQAMAQDSEPASQQASKLQTATKEARIGGRQHVAGADL